MRRLTFRRGHPDVGRESLWKRNETAPLDECLELDGERRHLLHQLEAMRAEQNRASGEIAKVKDKSTLVGRIAEMRELSQRIKELEPAVKEIDDRLGHILLLMPNLPDESVPVGKDDSENVVLRHWGEPPK